MKTSGDERSGTTEVLVEPPPSGAQSAFTSLLRLIGALAIPIVGFFVLWATFDFLRDAEANRFLIVGVAVVVGVGGVFFL